MPVSSYLPFDPTWLVVGWPTFGTSAAPLRPVARWFSTLSTKFYCPGHSFPWSGGKEPEAFLHGALLFALQEDGPCQGAFAKSFITVAFCLQLSTSQQSLTPPRIPFCTHTYPKEVPPPPPAFFSGNFLFRLWTDFGPTRFLVLKGMPPKCANYCTTKSMSFCSSSELVSFWASVLPWNVFEHLNGSCRWEVHREIKWDWIAIKQSWILQSQQSSEWG